MAWTVHIDAGSATYLANLKFREWRFWVLITWLHDYTLLILYFRNWCCVYGLLCTGSLNWPRRYFLFFMSAAITSTSYTYIQVYVIRKKKWQCHNMWIERLPYMLEYLFLHRKNIKLLIPCEQDRVVTNLFEAFRTGTKERNQRLVYFSICSTHALWGFLLVVWCMMLLLCVCW